MFKNPVMNDSLDEELVAGKENGSLYFCIADELIYKVQNITNQFGDF